MNPTPDEVLTLMESSKTELEWNANCDIVKSRCNGYPSFWFSLIVVSGIMNKVVSKFTTNK